MNGRKRRISDDANRVKMIPFGVASILVVTHCLYWFIDGGDVVWGLLFTILMWVLLLSSFSNLRTVGFDGSFLYLQKGNEKAQVPLEDVLSISQGSLSNRRTVSLAYRDSKGAVRKVWFQIRSENDQAGPSLLPDEPHPIVLEIQQHLDSWQRAGKPGVFNG